MSRRSFAVALVAVAAAASTVLAAPVSAEHAAVPAGVAVGDPNDDVHAFGVDAYGDTRSIVPAAPTVGIAVTPTGAGYRLAGADGGVFSYGDAEHLGSLGDIALDEPIVAIAAHPSGSGFWLAAADGGVFSFGDAVYHGSLGGIVLDRPIVGMAATPTGDGYWLVASDGGVFTFGDAEFLGSMGGIALNQPIVGMAATPTGDGYWLVASDGGVFTFGDAGFLGSTGAITLDQPIVAMAATPDADGYWLVASDGGVFTFGTAVFHGSAASIPRHEPVVGMAAAPDGSGYWLARRAGPTWPLTGLPADAVDQRPALAVKIDNHPAARGQWGLAQADVVFEELVEGGMTRFVAVFHSRDAARVGPIRSARETDLELLPMFGRTLLVFSGGNRTVRGLVADSDLVQGIFPDTDHGSAYFRTSLRRSPHNLLSATGRLWPFATGEVGAPPPVFAHREPVLVATPSTAEANGGPLDEHLTVDFGAIRVTWTWDGAKYLRAHGRFAHRDAALDRVAATNVIVLETVYRESRATGSPVAAALGTGRGYAMVDGHTVAITWERATLTEPYRLTVAGSGEPLLLAPGSTWVELAPAGLAPFAG